MPARGSGGGTQFRWRGVLDTSVEYPRNSWVEFTTGGNRLGYVAPTRIPANSPAPDQMNTLWVEFVSSMLTGPQGTKGNTGNATILLYIRSATVPTLPTDGMWDGTNLTVPAGYSISTPAGTDVLYALVAELDSDNDTFTAQAIFQAQGIQGIQGNPGTDSTVPGPQGDTGTGFVILYTRAATEPNFPTDGAWDGTTLTLPTGWTRTDPDPASADNLYSLLAELDSVNNTFDPIAIYSAQGIQGPPGDDAPRVDIQYSENNGSTWVDTPPANVTNLRFSNDGGTTYESFALPRGPQGIQGQTGPASTVPGPTGSGYAILYRRDANRPPLPTTGTWNGSTIGLPTNWHLNDPNPSSPDTLWALLVELDSVNNEFHARVIFSDSQGGGSGNALTEVVIFWKLNNNEPDPVTSYTINGTPGVDGFLEPNTGNRFYDTPAAAIAAADAQHLAYPLWKIQLHNINHGERILTTDVVPVGHSGVLETRTIWIRSASTPPAVSGSYDTGSETFTPPGNWTENPGALSGSLPLYRNINTVNKNTGHVTAGAPIAIGGAGSGVIDHTLGASYSVGQYVYFNGLEYRVIQAVDGTQGRPDDEPAYYTPTAAVSLRALHSPHPFTGASIEINADIHGTENYQDDGIELIMDADANSVWTYDADTRTWTLISETATFNVESHTITNLQSYMRVENSKGSSVEFNNIGLRLVKNQGQASEEEHRFVVRAATNHVSGALTTTGNYVHHTGSLSFVTGDTLNVEPYAIANPTSDSQYLTITAGNFFGNFPATLDANESIVPVSFGFDHTLEAFAVTDTEGNTHGVLDPAGQPTDALKSWADERDLVPVVFYEDTNSPTEQYASTDFTWNTTNDNWDTPTGVVETRPGTVTNELYFIFGFRTNEDTPVMHSVLPTFLDGQNAAQGPQGLPGLNAVSRTFSGTYQATQADVDANGEVHWVNDTTEGNFTIHTSTDFNFWSSLRVGTLVTARHNDSNYVQARIKTVINASSNPVQYEFDVLSIRGYVNGRTGTTLYIDVSQSTANEEIEYSNDNTTWSATAPANYRYIRTRINRSQAWNVTDLEQGSVVYIQYSADGTTWADSLSDYSYVRVRGSAEDSWKTIHITQADGGNVGQEIASCTLSGQIVVDNNDPIRGWSLNANAPTGFTLREQSGFGVGVNLPHTKISDSHLGYWVRTFVGTSTTSMHDATFEVGAQANIPIGGPTAPLSNLNLIVDPRAGDNDFFTIDASNDLSLTLTEDVTFRFYIKNSAPGSVGHRVDVESELYYFFTRNATTPDPMASYLITGQRGTDATLLPTESEGWHDSPNSISSAFDHLPLWMVIVRSKDYVRELPEVSPAIPLPHKDDQIRSHYDTPQVVAFSANLAFPDDTYIDDETDVTYTDTNNVFELADTTGSRIDLRALRDVEGDLTLDWDAIRSNIGVIRNATATAINDPDTIPHIGRVYLNNTHQETYLIRATGPATIAGGAEVDVGSGAGDTVVDSMTISDVETGDIVSIRFELAGSAPPDVSFKFAGGAFNIGVSGEAALSRPREVVFGVDTDGDLYTQHGDGASVKLLNEEGSTGRLQSDIAQRDKGHLLVTPLHNVPLFDNFAYWSFSRSIDGSSGVDLCDLGFYQIEDNGDATLIEDDITFQSNSEGVLDLYEIAERCLGYRTRATDPIDANRTISARIKKRYVQTVGSVNGTETDIDLVAGVLEVAYSSHVGHIAWSALGDTGIPMLNPLGTRAEETGGGISGNSYVYLMHFKLLPGDAEAIIADDNNFPRMSANQDGILVHNDHFTTAREDAGDLTQDSMMGFTLQDISGTTNDNWRYFVNGTFNTHRVAQHQAAFRVRTTAENAYIGDVFLTNRTTLAMLNNFPVDIMKSRYDDTGLFGKLYNGINLVRSVTLEYSADGSTGWTTARQSTDRYIRYSIDDGITWTDAVLIQEVSTQFSENGTGGWHSTQTDDDAYWRLNIHGTASPAIPIELHTLVGSGKPTPITGTFSVEGAVPLLYQEGSTWNLTPDDYFSANELLNQFDGNELELTATLVDSMNKLYVANPLAGSPEYTVNNAEIWMERLTDPMGASVERVTIAEMSVNPINLNPQAQFTLPFRATTSTHTLSGIQDNEYIRIRVVLVLDPVDTGQHIVLYPHPDGLQFNITGTQRDGDVEVFVEDGLLKSRNPDHNLIELATGDAIGAKALYSPDRDETYTPELRFAYRGHWQDGRTYHNIGKYFTAETGNQAGRLTWHGPPVEIEIHAIGSQDSGEPQAFAFNTSDTEVTVTEVELKVDRFENPNVAPVDVFTIADLEPDSIAVPAKSLEDMVLTIGTRTPTRFTLDSGQQLRFRLESTPAEGSGYSLSGGNLKVDFTATIKADGVRVDIEDDSGTRYLRYTDDFLPDAEEETRLIDLTNNHILIPTEPPRLIFYVEGQTHRVVQSPADDAKEIPIGTNTKVKIPFNLTADILDYNATNDIVRHLHADDVAAYVDAPIGTGNESGVLEFQAGEYDLEAHLNIQIGVGAAQQALLALRRGRPGDIGIGTHGWEASATGGANGDQIFVLRSESVPPRHISVYRYSKSGTYEHFFASAVNNFSNLCICATEDRVWNLGIGTGGNLGNFARSFTIAGTHQSAEDTQLSIAHEPFAAEYKDGRIAVLAADNAGEGRVYFYSPDFQVQHSHFTLPTDALQPYSGLTWIDDLLYIKRGGSLTANTILVYDERGTHQSDIDFSLGASYTDLAYHPDTDDLLVLDNGNNEFKNWSASGQRQSEDEKLDDLYYYSPGGTPQPFLYLPFTIPSIKFTDTEQVYFESDEHGRDIKVFGYLVVKQLAT